MVLRIQVVRSPSLGVVGEPRPRAADLLKAPVRRGCVARIHRGGIRTTALVLSLCPYAAGAGQAAVDTGPGLPT